MEVIGYESEGNAMGFAPLGPRGRLWAVWSILGSGARDIGLCCRRAYSRGANGLNAHQWDTGSNTDRHSVSHTWDRAHADRSDWGGVACGADGAFPGCASR